MKEKNSVPSSRPRSYPKDPVSPPTKLIFPRSIRELLSAFAEELLRYGLIYFGILGMEQAVKQATRSYLAAPSADKNSVCF